MHILIAPNAFKHSLTAEAAAAAILKGLEESRLNFTAQCFPVGDGGDGTGDLLMSRLEAKTISAPARDPFGRERMTYYGLSASEPAAAAAASGTAIIEMANASGLRLLAPQELAPLHAASWGTGDLIRDALEKGADRILVGMGGSATVDGGTGILSALGARFLDANGQEITDLPIGLADLASIDLKGLDPKLKTVELTVLCDVDNPLLGPEGAANVFGPQKGASQKDVQQLEQALQRFEAIVRQQLGVALADLPKGGTAGGAAAGLHGVLKARLVDGIDYYLNVSGFGTALERAHWVITGEGSLDEQTLKGKGPFGVANAAKNKGLPVIGLAGRLPREKIPSLDSYFDVLLPINHEAAPLADALPHTAANLTATARAVGNLLSISLA
jgi:glycerate 2-kinase